ncbi:MAG: hypothetical protein IKM33_05230 [Clostridia bacterium]|nr:hypothetical protein [Clostridia bacterium]
MNRKINITITALFLVFLFGFGIAFWIIPDTDFSPEENRALQTFPSVNAENWLDGKVSSQLITYYSDQFPLRNGFVGLHALSELGWGRGESNGVLVGEGGQLAVRRFDAYLNRSERLEDTDHYSSAHVDRGLASLVSLHKTLQSKGIPLCVLLAPRTVDVTAGDFNYPSAISDGLDATIENAMQAGGVNSVELMATFRGLHEAGEYVYYRTDHHWTTKGAYTAYTAVMESWGMGDQVLPTDDFTVREIPDFFGTTHSRAGLFFIPPDTLEIWEAPDDNRYTVYEVSGETTKTVIESGFISEKYLSEKDKYGAFLDGTHRMLFIVDKEAAARGETRPRLLLARDSFANSMVPFLARHFDICMVNLTGGMTNLTELCETYDCQRVLVVCNRENLIASDCFTQIQ